MGGCVSSNGDVNDRRQNVFHVWNVDELGNIFIPGQIEVTDTELVLYQKGKEPIRWPMRCLRRYGFDAELFSFESGRRCATGTGIYAFKCQRAEALFNLLQEQIQNSGQDNQATADVSSGPIGIGINSHSGVGNGVVVASAVAANGSILRSASLSVSDAAAGAGNYLEPIVRHRTRSIINNNNNNSTGFRDGFSRMATQSLPSNLAFAENAVAPSDQAALTVTPHYVNEDISSSSSIKNSSNCCSGAETVTLRSPVTPPAVLPALHEYANTTLMMTTTMTTTTDSALQMESVVRPKSLQECHQLSTSVDKSRSSTSEDTSSSSTTCASAGATASSKKVPYSILDLPKNMLVGATGAIKPGSNGCRQVVLRGHSLDETTNYARLDDLLKQENTSAQRHLYMNVVPDNALSKSANKDGGGVLPSNHHQHHHNYHHHNSHFHHHSSGAGLYGRQMSVESPSVSSASSGCGVVSTTLSSSSTTTTTKDSVNAGHHHHHRHHSNSISYHPSTTTTTTTISTSSASSAVSRQVNYAVLDLNHRGSNSSGGSVSAAANGAVSDAVTAPTSPVSLATPPESLSLLNPASCRTSSLEGYATIDFDRTVALSNVSSAHQRLDDDESVRKTRHNSTISDLLLSKHSSIVSE